MLLTSVLVMPAEVGSAGAASWGSRRLTSELLMPAEVGIKPPAIRFGLPADRPSLPRCACIRRTRDGRAGRRHRHTTGSQPDRI